METLTTSRLLLRPARPDDLDAMHEILSDPDAMRYWNTPPHTTREQSRLWLDRMIGADPNSRFEFVMEYSGALIGKAGLWRLPEIGFIVSPKYWGSGFAFEALAAIIPPAFAKFGMSAIVAEADPRNEACLKLLKRLKFVEKHRARNTIKVGDEWCDSVYFELPHPNA